MDPIPALDCWRVAFDSGLFVLIWLVQLIIYPSFLHIRDSAFQVWHHQYTGLIAIFVLPLMLGQTALYTLSTLTQTRWHDVSGLLCIAAVWMSTFLLSVPCHRRLHTQGYCRTTILKLVHTNWLRTALWSLVLIVDLGILIPSSFTG